MKFYDPQHKCDVVRELKEKANTLTASMGTGGAMFQSWKNNKA